MPLVCDYLQHYYMHKTFAEVYSKLGNTGVTVFHRFQAQMVICTMIPEFMRTDETRSLMKEANLNFVAAQRFRHPEPSLVNKIDVVDEKSHVLGSWRKLEVKNPVGGLGPRQGSSVFVHKGEVTPVGVISGC